MSIAAKCFLTSLPVPIRSLQCYQIYNAQGYTEDDLSFELLWVLKNKNRINHRQVALVEELSNLALINNLNIPIRVIQEEIQLLIFEIEQELFNRNFYTSHGLLIFNALWLDFPNALMFYQMQKEDVDIIPT